MFTSDDFLRLLKYFKDGTTTDIDQKLIINADDAKASTTGLFNDNLDLVAHATNDYKRLREFLINWYASLKTFTNTMRHATDVASLPEDHLNKLINSFGYEEKLDSMTRKNKIDFFYDLVNLYKIKGTPEAIGRILGYFGIPDVDLVEYWLMYNETKNLVLRPERIDIGNNFNIDAFDLNFEKTTRNDPHWMLTSSQINQLFTQNKIAFPSKTPYFGLRPIIQLVGNETSPTLLILSRLIQDYYNDFISGITIEKNILISYFKINASLLDLYLSYIYLFNKIYVKTTDSTDLSFSCYNGSEPLITEDIFTLYRELTSRVNSRTRDQIYNNKILFNNYFTRLRSTNFLTSLTTAGTILNLTNSSLKTLIDNNFDDYQTEILTSLVMDLSSWLRENISTTAPYLENLTLPFDSIDFFKDVINFFKPYRSRLILVEHVYLIQDAIFNSVITEDSGQSTQIDISQYTVDFDTADSEPAYLEDFDPTGAYITSTPPTDLCRKLTNIYLDSTGLVKCSYEDSTSYTNITEFLYSNPPIGCYRISNLFLECGPSDAKSLHVEYNENVETIGGILTKVYSDPLAGFYNINDMYLNSSGLVAIVYDGDPVTWPIDSTARIYYSRNLYDCGSYFDIGASCDDPPKYHELNINQYVYEIFNYHYRSGVEISPVNFQYTTDSTSGEVIEVLTDGAWSAFDEGWFFDAPPIIDICKILVSDL